MTTVTALPKLLTLQEVSAALRVTDGQVRELVRRGSLTAIRLHPRGRYRFPEEDVQRFIAQGGAP